MKKRLSSVLLTLALLLSLLPAAALAADPGIEITASTEDTAGGGYTYVKESNTLTLNGYSGGYIHASGITALNLVLEGENTITSSENVKAAYGVWCGNRNAQEVENETVDLNVSGDGSLTMTVSQTQTGEGSLYPNPYAYGIRANRFTMSGGVLNININSASVATFGVCAESGVDLTGGKITANFDSGGESFGLCAASGKICVADGAEVDVTLASKKKSLGIYGIYLDAASTDPSSGIELAGTVKVTRGDGDQKGYLSGVAVAIEPGKGGVISVTGGSLTVVNADRGIESGLAGASQFTDISITGGTVSISSNVKDSSGIYSKYNGISITGGTVTTKTVSSGIILPYSNTAGIVRLGGGAVVSLTSTGDKAIKSESDRNTLTHELSFTEGGSLTAKSTSSNGDDQTRPIGLYFKAAGDNAFTEGSQSGQTNGDGGWLFQTDGTTGQVAIAGPGAAPSTRSITITAGGNMTLVSGSANQTGLTGAMTDTVYQADDGYYFPTDYAVSSPSGISVTRDGYTRITVSGTPAGDVALTLPAATAKADGPAAPSGLAGAAPTTPGGSDGRITGTTTAMEYSADAGFTVSGACSAPETTGLRAGTYYVWVRETDTVRAGAYAEVIVPPSSEPAPKTYTVTFDANGGSVSPSSAVTDAGGRLSALPVPTRGGSYAFSGWFTAASGGTPVTASTVFGNDATIYAQWTYTGGSSGGGGSGGGSGGGGGTSTYPITVENDGEGLVKVSARRASRGSKITVTAAPAADYKLDALTVTGKDGKAVTLTEKDGKYSFIMPASGVIVHGGFVKLEAPPVNPFSDVQESDYFYDPVLWAAETGVASGAGSALFRPNAPCTRGQIVTFLWRAAGSPEAGGSNPFTDVASGSYYYDAVLWAVEQGVTNGTSAAAFSPDAACTRGQAMAFLYRTAKSPAVDGGSSFGDVAADAYYAAAVQWAVSEGITRGTSAAAFSPNAGCTRGQIVTFLYRWMT